ncbi:MAG: FAD-binding protein [Candidatus Latescibacteria bacterium]|nr:FAD-binding protein [Candidatus Latescibacterota bacterium]
MSDAVIISVALFAAVLLIVVLRRRPVAASAAPYTPDEGERFAHKWGYTDTRFEFDGPRTVKVTGQRYPIAGYSMPYLIPFAEEVLGTSFKPEDMVPENQDHPAPEPRANPAFLEGVAQALEADQISQDPKQRLVHSHGQLSVDETYRLLYGDPLDRLVDVVLYPQSEEDVQAIVQLAHQHDACLVPYGGGTNVTAALACPADEERLIASVDMRRMNQIASLDEDNMQACIEAGISGKQLELQLQARGFTTGHDPDSIEFSTLGGWISTNASGMKKNKYGNIEEIVVSATLVTPTGNIETRYTMPRNSTGIQPGLLLFGSEGNLGIITKAVLKLHSRPQVQKYGSLIFPDFAHGVAFLKELRQRQGVVPASIRLVNNFELRFGHALKSAPSSALKKLERKLQDFVLFKIKGFKPLEMAACTIAMEGTPAEVAHQEKVILGTGKRHKGMSGGSTNGQRGYMLTFGIAYIRDFFGQFNILGESFETSIAWDRIHDVTSAVRQQLFDQCKEHGIDGLPYLGFRVTQTYQTGVCIYFTMAFSGKGLDDPVSTYHTIEHGLRQTIIDHGGSLSHHHGIGKIRRQFMPQVHSDNSIDLVRQAKKALDPKNVFAVGNGVFTGPADGA